MTSAQPLSLAPCIVETGILVHKRDLYRVLSDLGYVRYQDIQDGQILREGEGYVLEVYEDPQAATIVVNRTLYINIHSFDYLSLGSHAQEGSGTVLDLVQEARTLRLLPMSDPLSDRVQGLEDTRALKEAVADAISSGWGSGSWDPSGPELPGF